MIRPYREVGDTAVDEIARKLGELEREVQELRNFKNLTMSGRQIEHYVNTIGEREEHIPYRTAVIITSFNTNDSGQSQTVSFPTGRFTEPPQCVVSIGTVGSTSGRQMFSCAVSNITSTQVQIHGQRVDGASSTLTVGYTVFAFQMNP